jgi:coproporphyrinogen III oxidase-like Fe-S oxidoreductase
MGFGYRAIGAFAQNLKKLPEYAAALADRRFPIARGYALDLDDLLRRHVIRAGSERPVRRARPRAPSGITARGRPG